MKAQGSTDPSDALNDPADFLAAIPTGAEDRLRRSGIHPGGSYSDGKLNETEAGRETRSRRSFGRFGPSSSNKERLKSPEVAERPREN